MLPLSKPTSTCIAVWPDQLQPAVGGDVLGSKFNLPKTLAPGAKIGFTQSHLEWPPCRVVWSVSQLLYLLQRQVIFSFLGHQFHLKPKFIVGLGLTT
jgi:hypothetical protein